MPWEQLASPSVALVPLGFVGLCLLESLEELEAQLLLDQVGCFQGSVEATLEGQQELAFVEEQLEHPQESVGLGVAAWLELWPQLFDASPTFPFKRAIHHRDPWDHHHQSGLGTFGH